MGASATQLQWVVDAKTMVFAGLLLIAGTARPVRTPSRLNAGMSLFLAGSVVAALSSSVDLVIAGRARDGNRRRPDHAGHPDLL